jgi:hypothetical protein
MKDVITLTGHVLVSDILDALEPKVEGDALLLLDRALDSHRDDRLVFDDVEVLVGEAVDALEDADKLPEPESLDYLLDQGDVQGLAEAIRCGERERAELLLDRVFAQSGASDTIREWIELGRYSMKARKAKAAETAKPKLRSAA